MNYRGNVTCLAYWTIMCALASGCQMQETPVPSVQRPSVKKDPCAEQLHDLCGQLLGYYGTHGRLPQSLDELATTEGKNAAQLVCPASGLAYVYEPGGLRVPGWPGLLVAYDATACHSSMRWGILVDAPGSSKSPTARVILLSEETLSSALKQP